MCEQKRTHISTIIIWTRRKKTNDKSQIQFEYFLSVLKVWIIVAMNHAAPVLIVGHTLIQTQILNIEINGQSRVMCALIRCDREDTL